MRSINFSCLGCISFAMYFSFHFCPLGSLYWKPFRERWKLWSNTVCWSSILHLVTYFVHILRQTHFIHRHYSLAKRVLYFFLTVFFSLTFHSLTVDLFPFFLELVITRCVGEDGKSTGLLSLIDSKEICWKYTLFFTHSISHLLWAPVEVLMGYLSLPRHDNVAFVCDRSQMV